MFAPINEHELRILATHYYLAKIDILTGKIADYKTNAPKSKAKTQIKDLFGQALQDEMVYRKAVYEFHQQYYQTYSK